MTTGSANEATGVNGHMVWSDWSHQFHHMQRKRRAVAFWEGREVWFDNMIGERTNKSPARTQAEFLSREGIEEKDYTHLSMSAQHNSDAAILHSICRISSHLRAACTLDNTLAATRPFVQREGQKVEATSLHDSGASQFGATVSHRQGAAKQLNGMLDLVMLSMKQCHNMRDWTGRYT